MFNIMVVEDDRNTRKLMGAVLEQNGYTPVLAKDGLEALEIMDHTMVDLIILDVMMPKMDGYEFAETLRSNDCNLPILMVTAKETIADKKRGFLIGVDDYMVKPIDLVELGMRLKALLRRADISNEKQLAVGGLLMKEDETTAYYQGEALPLTVKEFQILFKMLSYPKKTFTRMQLMDEFWGFDSESNPRTVDVTITKLRNKISCVHEIAITTVRGLGYKAVIQNED